MLIAQDLGEFAALLQARLVTRPMPQHWSCLSHATCLSDSVLQASSVCRKFSEASTLVPLSLNLNFEDALPPRLFSSLLMSWAHNVHTLLMDNSSLAVPGHAKFLVRAKGLQKVTVYCVSASASAAFDPLLSNNPCIVQLICIGNYTPLTFPPALRELAVSIGSSLSNSYQAQHFLAALDKSAVPLRVLDIELDPSSPVLVSPVVLPMLQELRISLSVGLDPVDLSWLRSQPCMHLCIFVEVYTQDAARQAQAMGQIQQLQVFSLELSFHCAFTSAVQEVWQPLSSCYNVLIKVKDPDCSKLELEALPRCLTFALCVPDYFHNEVLIHWAAVAHWDLHVGRNLYAEDCSCIPYVLKYLGCPAFNAAEPRWRVSVESMVQVVGIHSHTVPPCRVHSQRPFPRAWGHMLDLWQMTALLQYKQRGDVPPQGGAWQCAE